MNKVKTLVLSTEDWKVKYTIPDCINLVTEIEGDNTEDFLYDAVFVDRSITAVELQKIQQTTKAYTVFVTDFLRNEANIRELIKSRKGKLLAAADIQDFLSHEIRNYYPENYGEKFSCSHILVNDSFRGQIEWNGNQGITLNGDFGQSMSQVLYWKYNIPIWKEQGIDIYLEYEKDGDVEIELVVTQYLAGSINNVQKQYVVKEKDLRAPVLIDNDKAEGRLFIFLRAKGTGTLKIKALHDRYSRRGHGEFIPGGERHVTARGEEVFTYFDPGDMKPPLNVYFSGYKTKEGFEGYHMIKSMGCPFLLISESRLSGGAFYLGDDEYESIIPDVIKKCMDELGFDGSDVILSGLSMGTTGALYYSSDIEPRAVIIGKPLADIGTVAANERLFRPGGFPTSLDVLSMHAGSLDSNAQELLNKKVWDKIEKGNYSNTLFAVTYMIEDDYDEMAYSNLISRLNSIGVTLYGKGLHGRHNDETYEIVKWFRQRYLSIVSEEFGREAD